MTKRLYAVRIKQWVEVREGVKKPVLKVSKVRTEITVDRPLWYCDAKGYQRVKMEKVKRSLTIEQPTHEGGVVIKTLSYNTFQIHSGLSLRDREVKTIGVRNRFHAYLKEYTTHATHAGTP